MSTESDAPYQDFGAIEAALKETARGRAFLSNYARRIQQSDALKTLAMLGRLERISDELALRLAELEVARIRLANPNATSGAGLLQQRCALAQSSEAMSRVADDHRHPSHVGAADAHPHGCVNESHGATMQRIDQLAMVLGDLQSRAVQLAPHVDEASVPGVSAPPNKIDDGALAAPAFSLRSDDQHTADEEVLDLIAQALESTP